MSQLPLKIKIKLKDINLKSNNKIKLKDIKLKPNYKIKLKIKEKTSLITSGQKPSDDQLRKELCCNHGNKICVHKKRNIRSNLINTTEKYKPKEYNLIDIACESQTPSSKPCKNIECNKCYKKSFAGGAPIRFVLLWSLENPDDPRDILVTESQDRYFNCPNNCGHKFLRSPKDIIRHPSLKKGKIVKIDPNWLPECPNCKGLGFCNDNCAKCTESSFFMMVRKEQWSERTIDGKRLNGTWYPRDVTRSGKFVAWFDCDNPECNHVFQMSMNDISHGRWCPYCCNAGQKKFCDAHDCNWCHNHSHASHEKSTYMLKTNELKAHQIAKNSGKRILHDCPYCSHTFLAIPKNIAYHNNWCPYCSNPPKYLCEDDKCESCYKKSFNSHYRYIYLTKNNIFTARQTLLNCNDDREFACPDCHKIFNETPRNVNYGRWCPDCRTTTEVKLKKWLLAEYKNIFIKEAKLDWCRSKKTNNYLPFDFLSHELRLIIELDGAGHFKQVSNWESFEQRQNTDIYKMQCALNNGYSIIRLLQEDVYRNKNNWAEKLKSLIKIYDNTQILYIDNGDQYMPYEKKMTEYKFDLSKLN